VEIIELPDHPWFVAGQFHPELKSRLVDPHPLFKSFVKAVLEHRDSTSASRKSGSKESGKAKPPAKKSSRKAARAKKPSVAY